MPRVEISVGADDFRIFEVDLTDQEFTGVKKVLDAYGNDNIGYSSGPYTPFIRVVDIDAAKAAAEKERKEKEEAERVRRAEEEKRCREEHERDVRENGAFAVAYRRALEKKMKKVG